MEAWGDDPINTSFKVKFYLDTNILSLLIDETYLSLNESIKILQSSPFTFLVCSSFGVFELAGIRKREHYFREVVKNSPKTNISSLVRYKDELNAPNCDYKLVKDTVKAKVLADMRNLSQMWEIDPSDNILHRGLLAPTIDICLTTKVSKEDSLMFTSAILPQDGKPEPFVVMLTKDKQFSKAINEFELDTTLNTFSLKSPKLDWIQNISLNNNERINLMQEYSTLVLKSFWIKKVVELILNKNSHLFLGKTFKPNSKKLPNNLISFKLEEDTPLNNDIYVTIINKDLTFIYTSKTIIKEFQHNGTKIKNGFTSISQPFISFLLNDENNNPVNNKIIEQLRDECFIFIHPDSYE